MSDQRIVHIELDRKTLVSRSAEVEHERAAAIYDLLEENHFAPVGDFSGPYQVHMRVEDANRLVIDVSDNHNGAQVSIAMSPLRDRK